MSVAQSFHSGTLPRRFSGLARQFEVRPIRSQRELDLAMQIIDSLAIRDRLTADQRDYLEALSTMVEVYERDHTSATAAGMSPVEALRFLLEENGMSGSDLGRLLGVRQLGSAILRGKRSLSKAHISALCKRFNVDASLFIA